MSQHAREEISVPLKFDDVIVGLFQVDDRGKSTITLNWPETSAMFREMVILGQIDSFDLSPSYIDTPKASVTHIGHLRLIKE